MIEETQIACKSEKEAKKLLGLIRKFITITSGNKCFHYSQEKNIFEIEEIAQ